MASINHFVLFTSTVLGSCYICPVDINKNENGYYNVKKTTILDPASFDVNKKEIKRIGSINNFFVPIWEKTILDETNYYDLTKGSRANDHFVVSCKIYTSSIDKIYGKKFSDTEKVRYFIDDYLDVYDNVRYLVDENGTNPATGGMTIATGNLKYAEHKRGNWKVKRTCTYWAYVQGKRDENKNSDTIVTTFDNNTKEIKSAQTTYKKSVFENKTGKTYKYSTPDYTIVRETSYENSNTVSDVEWKLHSTLWEFSLSFDEKLLAAANTWEVGAVYITPRVDQNYCFYSTDGFGANYLSYFTNKGYPVVTAYDKANLLHSCISHGGTVDPNDITAPYLTTSTVVDGIEYKRAKLPVSSAGTNKSAVVKHLSYGTKGTYVDGVATLPYVIIELRGQDKYTDESDYHSLSIPANSFVSLTHERNLGDGYNTFNLQLFDKDALQVESWLLLGFRYITFYYTDFVSTSKRFKGQVLDYKTVISGKGLMLTLSGYTSNADIYTGKESIPWSKLIEAQAFSFYYWLNEAGEYHGELRKTTGSLHNNPDNPSEKVSPADIYNSTEGIVLSPSTILEESVADYEYVKNLATYSLQAPVVTKDSSGQEQRSTEWFTFDTYYSNVDEEIRDKYRPTLHQWGLDAYNYNLYEMLGVHTQDYWTEPRPSNIVILIAAINGWKINLKYITRTRKVSDIPDQVSMSFTEYIKKYLIPISIAEGSNATTQFYLWFDDNGYVHYGPKTDTKITKLYFNAKDIPDSYPLIAFTSATNGSVLMQADATQTISAINVYTGDELNVSAVLKGEKDLSSDSEIDDPEIIKSLHQSEEWFVTNSINQNNKTLNLGGSKLVSYSNSSVIPSQEDLEKQLRYRYGVVSQYSFNASLDVYGCSDIEPGQMVEIYIYLGDHARTNEGVVETDSSSPTGYIGNITLHHSSGRYFVNKITDTISGGKYVSSLNVLKLNQGVLDSMMGNTKNTETYELEQPKVIDPNDLETSDFNQYTQFKNLKNGL